jgi:hypothetical protein
MGVWLWGEGGEEFLCPINSTWHWGSKGFITGKNLILSPASSQAFQDLNPVLDEGAVGCCVPGGFPCHSKENLFVHLHSSGLSMIFLWKKKDILQLISKLRIE